MIHVISTSVAPVRVRDVTVVLHIHTTLQDGLFFATWGVVPRHVPPEPEKKKIMVY